jgi:hypothetical protein
MGREDIEAKVKRREGRESLKGKRKRKRKGRGKRKG